VDYGIRALQSLLEVRAVFYEPFLEFYFWREVGGFAVGVDSGLEAVQDADLVAALEEEIHGVGAYEAGAAGD